VFSLLFLLDGVECLSWIKSSRRKDTLSTPDRHLQTGHDHTEAVKERYWHTNHRLLHTDTQTDRTIHTDTFKTFAV